MADIDLSKLDLDELKSLRKELDKTIENYETRRRQDALAAAEASAREMGYSLSELMDGQASKKGKKQVNPPKYRHPENPDLTWSGRGRQPAWIKDGLEQGKTLEEFAIA